MRHRLLGNTGLQVSPIGLGTLTWGRDTTLSEAEDIFNEFLAIGGNLIDTSPTYGEGAAESTVGEVLQQAQASRDDVVIVTKGGFVPAADGNRFSASKNALLGSIDRSLRALQTDYIDVYLLQRPDPMTPIEETLSTLDIALRSGRIRYIGIANHSAWDTAQMHFLAQQLSTPLAAVSAEYSLLQRGVERELLPGVQKAGLGFIAWSALARGVLTAKYRHSTPPDSRAASPILSGFVQPYLTERHSGIVEAVLATANGLDTSPTTVALAWLKNQPRVTSALVGPRTGLQMKQIAEGAHFVLPQPLVDALNDVSAIEVGYPETNAR
ncbi:MAG: aldo/keto reductase [Actinomycetaceae bacterium]|nr:aldo/keto reductase [Actinomycetaceae bacterium]